MEEELFKYQRLAVCLWFISMAILIQGFFRSWMTTWILALLGIVQVASLAYVSWGYKKHNDIKHFKFFLILLSVNIVFITVLFFQDFSVFWKN